MENFKEKFNALLTDKLNISLEELKPEATFFELGANSLDMVELIIEFEKAFAITINDEEAERIVTLHDAEEYLRTKLGIT